MMEARDTMEDVKIRTLEDVYQFSSIVLWGAGFAYEDTIQLFGRERISAVFDNDEKKWGKNIGGFVVKSPKEDLNKFVGHDTAVVISSNGYQYEIAQDLVTNKGLEIGQIFCNTNKIVEEWRYNPQLIRENWERILRVRDRLADGESKEYYINFMKACLTRNPLYYTNHPRCTDSYVYQTDLAEIGVHRGDVILDCGAYNGDTARIFRSKTGNECEVYCFEPVVENYNELLEWIQAEKIDSVHAVHVGVGKDKYIDKVYSTEDKTTRAAVGSNRFNSETPVVSEIQVDTLDNVMGNKHVDYIKMDIEGAEMDALQGGSNVIANSHPQMLISAYHKITDMWEIPEFVLQIAPEYRIFLGHQPHAPYEPEFLFV